MNETTSISPQLTEDEIASIKDLAKYAQKHPYQVSEINLKGFRFLIHYARADKWFNGTMLFSPTWGHTHGVSGRDGDGLVESIQKQITESMVIFESGGLYGK